MIWTMTFDNDVVVELSIPGAVEADVRTQMEYEVSQGWHSGVDSTNTFTITNREE